MESTFSPEVPGDTGAAPMAAPVINSVTVSGLDAVVQVAVHRTDAAGAAVDPTTMHLFVSTQSFAGRMPADARAAGENVQSVPIPAGDAVVNMTQTLHAYGTHYFFAATQE